MLTACSTQWVQIAQNSRFELALGGGKVRKYYHVRDQRDAQSRTFMNRRIVFIRRERVYIIYHFLVSYTYEKERYI